jgi:hypothetical protein
MNKLVVSSLLVGLLCGSGLIRAQSASPPAGDPADGGARLATGAPSADRTAPSDAQPPPAAPPREVDAPAAEGDRPAKGDRPAEGAPPADGGHLPGAGDPDAPGPKPWPKVMYGLGISGMYNLVPHFFLRAFLEAAKSPDYGMYQPAFGIHFVRRKGLMDMTIRVMFGFYDLADGNYLGRGHGFDETDYTEFHDMNFLWADITWTWHTRLVHRLYLAYGAGIGIGWVTGSVYTTPSENCSRDNYGDARDCKPQGLSCDKDGCDRADLKAHPLREKEDSVPPVLPAINALIGLRYDFFRHLSARLDTGIFLPGFWYVQLGVTAMF